MNSLKRTKDRAVNFVKRHPEGCVYAAYVAYVVACIAGGVYVQKKVNEHQQAQLEYVISNEMLRQGVAAGHSYRYEPETDTLWDLTVRPDKAA